MRKKCSGLLMLMITCCLITVSCEKKELDGEKRVVFNYTDFDFPNFNTEMYETLRNEKTIVIQSGAEYRKLFVYSSDIDFSTKTLLLGSSTFNNMVDSYSQSFYKNAEGKYIYKIDVKLKPQVFESRIYYGIIVNKVTNDIHFEVETGN